jgi:chitinase
MPEPKLITLVHELSTWYPPGEAIEDLLTHMGAYTHVVLGGWTRATPRDAAAAWADPNTIPADAIDRFHALGLEVLIAGGGPHEDPILADPGGGAGYGRRLAEFAREHQFDGVQFQIDSLAGFERGCATDWLIAATTAARAALPDGRISHVGPAPAFADLFRDSYLAVDQACGAGIDFYVVRYFDCGDSAQHQTSSWDDYESLFHRAKGWASRTAIDELHASGMPSDKLVIGKPCTPIDARIAGYVAPDVLADLLRRRRASGAGIAGLMGWHWSSDRKQLAGSWSRTVAAPLR